MANFDQLKQSVAALIRTNGAEEITGQIMQDVLLTIINSISGGYMFGGVAQHSGNVGNPDYNVFYLAGSGAYTGYGGAITIENGCYGVFRYNGSWHQEVVDIGVRLSGSIVAGETRGVTGDTINTALQTLFDNVMDILDTLTFTYNTPSAQQATKAMLDVIMTPTGGAPHVFATLTLASATVAAAGLMSAEDKQKVDRMLTDFRSLSLTDTTAVADQATKIVQTLSATLGENPEAITTFTLLAATASKAGLMSAADKSYLDSLPAVITGINGAISDNLARVLAMMGYYECSTAAGTAAKEVSASGYSLTSGGCIRIKMTNANTANNATLNINSTGAKSLYYDGAQASSTNTWEAGEVLEVYYDGEQYQCASGGGGGKFASGENVKEVSITDEITENSNDLPTSGAVEKSIDNSEKVIAQALSVHNEKLQELENEVQNVRENSMGEDEAFVIAQALTELESRTKDESDDGGTSAVSGVLTIENSEIISVVGSSFGTGSFNLAGKNWCAKLSLFSDYQFENISYDGFNYTQILRYLRLGQIVFKGRYALLCDNENTSMEMKNILRSLINIATWMRTNGSEPILATSYSGFQYQSALWHDYAEKNNLMFWDAGKYCARIRDARNGEWDSARHLATRNSQMVTDAYMPYMQWMERPMKSIKVFRMRDSVDYTSLDNVMFFGNDDRAKLFKELYIGVQCNSNPASVDGGASAGTLSRLDNEYRILSDNGLIFSCPILISAVLPINASDLTLLSLGLESTTGIKVYVMNRKMEPFPQAGTYSRFSVPSEITTPSSGAVYSVGGTQYSVVAVVPDENGYYCTIYCSPSLSSTVGAGVMTKVSGQGEDTINFEVGESSTLNETDIVISDKVGHWEELTLQGGQYILNAQQLKDCVETDVIHYLIIPQESSTFISNIAVRYGGEAIKPSSTRRYYSFEDTEYIDSPELLDEPVFGNVGTTLTSWEDDNHGSVVTVADYENKYPLGCSSIVQVDNADAIIQTIQSSDIIGGKYILEVISRYFPPIYTDGTGNQITLDSYDYEDLCIKITGESSGSQNNATLTDRIGTYWKISQFEIDIFTIENITLRMSAGSKGIEICKVSLKKIR